MSNDTTPYGLCLCGCGGHTPLARQTDTRRGYVKGEPVRWIPGHNARGRNWEPPEPTPCACGCGQMAKPGNTHIHGHSGCHCTGPEYIEEDRGYDTPCWIWQRACTWDGYGAVRIRGKLLKAHRVFYERYVGPIPDGLHIDHLCRVRGCVNPAHLEPVTQRENNLRSLRARQKAALD